MFYHVKDLQFNARVSRPDRVSHAYCLRHLAVLMEN